MKRGPGASVLLERALTTSAARAGIRLTVSTRRATAWHSATFAGARHLIAGETHDGIDAWAERLRDEDLPLPGHLVADTSVSVERVGACTRFAVEAVTVSLD